MLGDSGKTLRARTCSAFDPVRNWGQFNDQASYRFYPGEAMNEAGIKLSLINSSHLSRCSLDKEW